MRHFTAFLSYDLSYVTVAYIYSLSVQRITHHPVTVRYAV